MTDGAFGLMLALGSAVSFALSNNFIQRTTRSGGDKGVMFSVVVTIGMSAVLWLVVEGGRLPEVAAPDGLLWFALAGVAAMVFGRSLLYASIRRLGVARSTAVKRLNPFFTVLLAAVVLGEAVRLSDTVGMVAIALAFGILLSDRMARRGIDGAADFPPSAYLLGVGSSLAYALSYVLRKLGLLALPSPALGTLVSALAGFAAFLAIAAVSRPARANLTGMFTHLDRWVVLAAVLVSSGQILLFAALAYAEVAAVAMVASLEIFISIALSVFVFRSEPMPGPRVLVSAVLAMVGVGLVAL